MTSWGNQENTQHQQDMESPMGYHLRVTKNDATDIALGSINQLGTAIRSTGKLVVDGLSDLNGDVDVDAKLDVMHDSSTETAVTIQNASSGLALHVAGKMRVQQGGSFSLLTVENLNDDGFALDVNGRLDVNSTAANAIASVTNGNHDALALYVGGRVLVDNETAETAVAITNSLPEGAALQVNGRAEINIDAGPPYDALKITNAEPYGKGLNCQCPVEIKKSIQFNDAQEHAYINSADGKWLQLNTQGASSSVRIGRLDGPETSIWSELRVRDNVKPLASSLNLAMSGVQTRVKGPLVAEETATFDRLLSANGGIDADQETTDAVLDVTNTSTDQHAKAIRATGSYALDAHGRSSFSDHMALASDKKLALDGSAAQFYIVHNSAQERIEFYIGGTLKFIIDRTGGHNP